VKIGVQLYTVRDQMAEDLTGTLKRLAEAGLKHVELAGLSGKTPEEFGDVLRSTGLSAVSAHVGLAEVRDRLEETAALYKGLGCQWLVVPWAPKEEFADGGERLGQELASIGKLVRELGMRLAYHNHDFEFMDLDGAPAYAVFWDSAARTLEAELDLYWCHHAGQDPVDWLGKLKGRVPLTHFKDGHGGVFHPVGQGDLDWDSIIPAARSAGVEWALIELDSSPKDPVECVVESYRFLVERGLEG
jgi:sugar phosphate isomerase/epimerase